MSTFCVKCGFQGGPDDRFCGSCGAPLGADSSVATPAPPAATPGGAPASGAPAGQVAELVDQTYRKVGDWLRQAGYKFIENGPDKSYTALSGSTFGVVKVMPAGEDDTWVRFSAPVVCGATLSPDLLEFLLRKNADYAATKFDINTNNEIWLQYSVFGSVIDFNTCRLSLAFVLTIADQMDDEIRGRWGGRTGHEVIMSA